MRYRVTWNQMGSRHGGFARVVTGLCLLLLVAGSLSMAYGSVAPHWTLPHCPHGQTHGGQHTHSQCVWHCDGFDAQAAAGRSGNLSDAPTGFAARTLLFSQYVAWFNLGFIPRGPPPFNVTT